MSSSVKPLKQLLSMDAVASIDKWIAKYPPERKRSAVMWALTIAQEENGGHLTEELMNSIADYLDMSDIAVYEVASFYSMYTFKPVGKHVINICTNISCQLRGSEEIVAHLENKLNIKLGETTADGKITLKEVECQAACCGAPMACIGKQYHENLTTDKVDDILSRLE